MFAIVKIYRNITQVQKVDAPTMSVKQPKAGLKVDKTKTKSPTDSLKTVVAKQVYRTSITVSDKLPVEVQTDKIIRFASHVIGARVAAACAQGSPVPGKLFFELDINGDVFRSETILAKAQYTDLIKVSIAKLKGLSHAEIIAKVKKTQIKGLSTAGTFMRDVEDAAIEANSEAYDNSENTGINPASLKVTETGVLVPA